jgi:5-methylcytosine-specific restriction endonuclease McrA
MSTKYTKETLQEAVNDSISVMEVMRKLGLKMAGGTHAHLSRKIKLYEIDTSHFKGQAHNKGRTSTNKLAWQDVLVYDRLRGNKEKRYLLKRAMVDSGIMYQCLECSQGPEWMGRQLVIEIDHINGDNLDNTKENLRFLCPNCHSQEQTTNKPHKYR